MTEKSINLTRPEPSVRLDLAEIELLDPMPDSSLEDMSVNLTRPKPAVRFDLAEIELLDPMPDSCLEDICRICHRNNKPDCSMITPCYCSNDLRYVHDMCLKEQIKSSQTRCCEICKFHFIMYSKMKPLRKWKKLDMPDDEQPKVLRSILIHVGMIAWLVVAIYAQIDPTKSSKSSKKSSDKWPLWVWVLAIIIAFIGELIYLYVHCRLFRRWWIFNRVIHVQNAPEKGSIENQQQRKAAVPVAAKRTASVPTADSSKRFLSDEDEFQSCQSSSNSNNINANDMKNTFTKMHTDETVPFKTTLTSVTDNNVTPGIKENPSFSEIVVLSTTSDSCDQSSSNSNNINTNDMKNTFTKMPTDETVPFKTTLTSVTDNNVTSGIKENPSFSEIVVLPTTSDSCDQSSSNSNNINTNDMKTTFTKMPTDETVPFKTTLTSVTDNNVTPGIKENPSFSEIVVLSTTSDSCDQHA